MNRITHHLISIVVPAYDEAESLIELFQRVKKTMTSNNIPFEFIVIDDGSSDDSHAVLKEIAMQNNNVVVIRHGRNHGKSMALMHGFHFANGDIAITMDADIQEPPEAIPLLLAKLNEGYDLVNGWRKPRKDKKTKIIVSKIYNRVVNYIFSLKMNDVNCGFKAMRKEVYSRLKLKGDLHRLIPVIAHSRGFKCCEVPVPHNKRRFGRSKYKLLRHRGLLDIVALMATNTTRVRPFHFFSEVAFFFFLFTMLFFGGCILLAEGVFSKVLFIIGFWTLFIGTILPFFGFLLEIISSEIQTQEWSLTLLHDIIDNRKNHA